MYRIKLFCSEVFTISVFGWIAPNCLS